MSLVQRYISFIVLTVLGLSVAVAQAQDPRGACCNFVAESLTFCINDQIEPNCQDAGDVWGGADTMCGEGDVSSFPTVEECLQSLVALPVELTSFESTVTGNDVVLVWATASEVNNAGFSIEREIASGFFDEVAFAPGQGTTAEPNEYRFTITDLDPGLHRFRLKQIDFDGTFEYSPVVEAALTVPDRFLIEPAYPNPFNPSTIVRYAVNVAQTVTITLLDARGRAIRRLFQGTAPANAMQSLTVDAHGLASGAYLVHLEGNGIAATERIILAK